MKDRSESALRAGLLLRLMQELGSRADVKREELATIQQQAEGLHEKWKRLMREMGYRSFENSGDGSTECGADKLQSEHPSGG
jgi:hypothetical protein